MHTCGEVVLPGETHTCEYGLLSNLGDRGVLRLGAPEPDARQAVQAHDAILRGIRMGYACAVHVHTDMVPAERHHVWPLGMGGPDTPDNIQTVCANGHGQIHAYLDLLIRWGPQVPWEFRKHYGTRVRELAVQGWTLAGSPRRQ